MGQKEMQLVTLTDGEARVSTIVIAEGTKTQHKAVIQLVRTYMADLEEFGRVTFEMAPFETAGGTQTRECANLNDQQSALIMTYMKNTEIVRTFKKQLVREFYALAKSQPKIESPMQALEVFFSVAKEHEGRINILEQTRRLENWQQCNIKDAVNAKVADLAENHTSAGKPAIYPKVWRCIKQKFDVPRYNEIPAIRYDEALSFTTRITMAHLAGL